VYWRTKESSQNCYRDDRSRHDVWVAFDSINDLVTNALCSDVCMEQKMKAVMAGGSLPATTTTTTGGGGSFSTKELGGGRWEGSGTKPCDFDR